MSTGSALPHQATKSYEAQSDIGGIKTEKDGSWKRQVSSFRHFVKEGGEFPPEKGMSLYSSVCF